MRRPLLWVLVLAWVLVGCAAKYPLPATEAQLQGRVTTAEAAYKALYQEHKAGQLSHGAMGRVDELYVTWQQTQRWLMDAVKAGAVTLKE